MTSPIYTALFAAIDAAMDNVADMDTTRQDYAKAATEAVMKLPEVAAAFVACKIIKDVISEGHDNFGDMVLHFLEAAEPASVALARSAAKEAAKAAAQSHADAANWANTVIGSETTK